MCVERLLFVGFVYVKFGLAGRGGGWVLCEGEFDEGKLTRLKGDTCVKATGFFVTGNGGGLKEGGATEGIKLTGGDG